MQPVIETLLDPVVNFGKVTVSTGYNNTDGSIDTPIVLNLGHGAKLPNPDPDGSFNLVWFNSSTYASPEEDPNVEIVRCIARNVDTLIVIRGQEGTSASNKNTPNKIYKMILSITKKTITDIKTEYQSGVSTHSALSTGVHGVGADTIDSIDARNTAISTHAGITSSIHGFDSSGNAPAQSHGSLRHTGIIGDHTNLTSIGTKTHATIDTAIDTTLPGLVTTHAGLTAAHGATGAVVGTINSQALTNKTITDSTNNVTAKSLKSTTTTIDVSTSSAPISGQVLTATGNTTATWQNPAPGVPSAPPLPQNVPKIASTTIRNSHDAQTGTSSTSFVLLKTTTLTNGLKGTIRLYVDTYSLDVTGWTFISFRINAVEVARINFPQSNWTTQYVDATITLLPGESIQLYAECHNGTMYLQNWRLAYDNDPNIVVPATYS